MRPRKFPSVLKAAAKEWGRDKATRHAAALSYYTVFSLAPLLLIAISVAGLVFGQEAARNRIVEEFQGFLGRDGAQIIQTLIENAAKPASGIIGTAAGLVVLLFGASGVFGQIQASLDEIWGVRPKPKAGLLAVLRKRFLSFSMVLVIGFMLMVSLVLGAALSAAAGYLGGALPEGGAFLMHGLDLLINFGALTVLFALLYKVLPDAKIAWGDVWTGAVSAALLFTVGRFLIGFYLGRASVGSAFGAAGSLVILMIWVYYSAQILFFGAEITQAYAARYGSRVVPAAHHEKSSPDKPAVVEAAPEAGDRPRREPAREGGRPRTAPRPRSAAAARPRRYAEGAARFRRGVAMVWRHRRALARVTAVAVPLLWAFTGHGSDPARGARPRPASPARKWAQFIFVRRGR